MVDISQANSIDTRSALLESLHSRFKEEYVLRLLKNPDIQMQAEHIAETQGINIWQAWYVLLTARVRA